MDPTPKAESELVRGKMNINQVCILCGGEFRNSYLLLEGKQTIWGCHELKPSSEAKPYCNDPNCARFGLMTILYKEQIEENEK